MSRRKKQPSLSFVIISIIAASDILTWSRALFNHQVPCWMQGGHLPAGLIARMMHHTTHYTHMLAYNPTRQPPEPAPCPN
jgi:hypothetical protein